MGELLQDIEQWRLPLGRWVAQFVDWLTETFPAFFEFLTNVLLGAYEALADLFTWPPDVVMILILGVLGLLARGWKFGIGGTAALFLISLLNLWEPAMETLALIVGSVVIATVLAIPVGIAAARSDVVSNAVRPVLDFMQTMPPLVYLIPAIFFFGVGVVPGLIATIVFAMPPGVRLTELGIRQVDQEVVEAGHAFGSSPGEILRQIQIPLARPTIMAGVNQVIMLALSMVVLAGFVGAPGLGQEVLSALSRVEIGPGAEAGLSVVILAIYLDRVTAALGTRSGTSGRLAKLKGRLAKAK
ncbi:ABC transporter permease [Haloechinothrix halophila]|uniref:ABC transporter permease n=1 Tax=Haloechinothrix halophila TaxID=1069073 RepID=UPI000427171A|nr:proline/glycine betaine ABC transporter permease [Haloechinothrix halophila]